MPINTVTKAIAHLLGAAILVLTTVAHFTGGFLPQHWLVAVQALIALLTAVSVWLFPNNTAPELVTTTTPARKAAGSGLSISKLISSTIGVALIVLTTALHFGVGFLPADWLALLQGVIGVLTTVSTWGVRNKIVHSANDPAPAAA